jgi:CIC family chloride channel protein
LALVGLNRWLALRGRTPVDVVEANALHGGRIPMFDNLIIGAQTVISNGCGASVGLEAAYAQLGGGLASWLGQKAHLRRADLRTLVGAGAGAGVGAAFGAPLAGAFYAFEIVIGTYSTAAVAPVVAASLLAAALMRWLGPEPWLMAATDNRIITLGDYAAYAVLGLVCALLGIFVMRLVTAAERVMQAITRSSPWRPVLGALLLMPVAWLSPQALSAGHGALHLDLAICRGGVSAGGAGTEDHRLGDFAGQRLSRRAVLRLAVSGLAGGAGLWRGGQSVGHRHRSQRCRAGRHGGAERLHRRRVDDTGHADAGDHP